MSTDESTTLDAAQLEAHLRHSPRAVAKTAVNLAFAASRGQRSSWDAFVQLWGGLHDCTAHEAAEQTVTAAAEPRAEGNREGPAEERKHVDLTLP